MKPGRLILAVLFTAGGATLGEERDQVLVTYEAALGDRQISGVSRSMEWSAIRPGDGTAHVRLRVPVDSFDSGHANFDSLVRAALQSDRHPFVEVEGVARRGGFSGTLSLRGVARPVQIPVTVVELGTQLVLTASFSIDLRQYGIALPSIAPRVAIDFVARLSASPRAVFAGGGLSSN